MADDWDPFLARQLKKLGDAAKPPTDEETWKRFLRAVNEHCRHMNDDRNLLTRSIDISTSEMSELRTRVEGQRDQLRALVLAIGDALGFFGRFVSVEQAAENTYAAVAPIETAKQHFSAKLSELFDEGTDPDTSAELSGIRSNLARLADQLIRLLSETAEKASLKKELEVASAVQHMLVPGDEAIERAAFRVVGHFQPAAECGGDWWSTYDLAEGRLLVLAGDVTGHGISSAIITGAAKAACDLACRITKGVLTSDSILQMMNATIHDTGRRKIMMTCAASVLDPRARTLTLSNAGHHFPYLIRDGQVRPVMAHGQPLGAAPAATYEAQVTDLATGDIVVWFTDGLIECENELGEQFSDRRLRAVCQRASREGPKAVRDAVVEALNAFRGKRPQIDDITLVVASVK
jgi:phosphoserine phosphatase RsbU/P